MLIPLLALVIFAMVPTVVMMTVGNAQRTQTTKKILQTRHFREMLRMGPQEMSMVLKEDFFSDHYSPESLELAYGLSYYWNFSEADFDYGTSEPVLTSSAAAKILFASAVQKNVSPHSDKKETFHLNTLFTFRNDALRFGLVVENPLIVDNQSPLKNTIITGGVYVQGDLDSSAGNVTFSGRPLLVAGNVLGGPNMTLTAGTTMYYGLNLNVGGASLMGPVFGQLPPVDVVNINLNYYLAHNRRIVAPEPPAVSTTVWWNFADDPVTGDCRCYYEIADPTLFWEAHVFQEGVGWPVFVLQDGNINLSGRCSAKVTVVSQTDTPGANSGNIIIAGDVGQSDGFTVSSSTRAFAVLASNQIQFDNPGGAITARGYYRAQQITFNANTQVTVQGTAHVLAGFPNAPAAQLTIQYDPDLFGNLPPRIPERPVMVTYTSKQ
jgi:hypothetical protein